MWNGAAEALNASPEPGSSAARGRNPGKVDRTGGAVDEGGSEQQYCGAKSADDEVLQRRLQAAEPVAIDRAEDVQADREPLQRQEERHQVVRAGEEHHSGSRSRKKRVVLADVILTPALAIRDRRRNQTRAGNDDRSQFRETVTAEGVHDDTVSLCRLHVERNRETECCRVPDRAQRCSHGLACRRRGKDSAQEGKRRGRQQRIDWREREPVDVRPWDHLKP